MQLLSKEDKTKFKLYAVNVSSEPNIVYEFDAYINYGQLIFLSSNYPRIVLWQLKRNIAILRSQRYTKRSIITASIT